MQQINCPSCGAPVEFKSVASVTAVCEYCKSTLLRSADAVKDLGKMSEVLEDYSPIQMGTSGRYLGQEFTIIGRIQLHYSAGFWNEWYILFQDGSGGWLSEASGQYTITRQRELKQTLPPFTNLNPAQLFDIGGKSYAVSDVRNAQCVGGQGELPHSIGTGKHTGWEAKVVDLRHQNEFITLDYSDSEIPTLYLGQAVHLKELQCQLLRDVEEIARTSGKMKGKVTNLGCPSCGSPTSYIPGKTVHTVCASCGGHIETHGPISEVIATGERIAQVHTTLDLGMKINYGGGQYELIGLMKRQDEEWESWTEYLFYSFNSGFVWFIETKQGWYRTAVLDDWPILEEQEVASYLGAEYKYQYQYYAKVTFVIGSFNWRVQVGDQVLVREFKNSYSSLAMELTHEEMTWSMSVKMSPDQLKAVLGDEVASEDLDVKDYNDDDGEGKTSLGMKMIYALFILNFIPLMEGESIFVLFVLLVAAALIYIPETYFMDDED